MELKTQIQGKSHQSLSNIKQKLSSSRSIQEVTDKENELKETIKYHTREAFIHPLNEHTLKKRKIKEEEQEEIKKQKEKEKRAELEQKMRLLELNEKQRKKEEEEELRAYRREKRHIEEIDELEKLVSS